MNKPSSNWLEFVLQKDWFYVESVLALSFLWLLGRGVCLPRVFFSLYSQILWVFVFFSPFFDGFCISSSSLITSQYISFLLDRSGRLFLGGDYFMYLVGFSLLGEFEDDLLKKSWGNFLLGTLILMDLERVGEPSLKLLFSINIIASYSHKIHL